MTSVHHTSRGEAGRLAIGFYTSLSVGNLRATLVDYQKRFSKVDVSMKESSRLRLVTALRNGVIDIAIVTGEMPLLDSKGMPLWSERTLVALSEDHPPANRDIVYWTDLRGETVLLSQYDPGRELEDLLTSKLVSPEDRPKIKRHDVSRGIIKSLVSAGFGVSLVTESDISATSSGPIYRELRDGAGPSRIGYSGHWREDNDNPALASFLATNNSSWWSDLHRLSTRAHPHGRSSPRPRPGPWRRRRLSPLLPDQSFGPQRGSSRCL